MARTGQFGRQPRVAPSLQATLLAIAREFQQQRDQNLMDAWQKGGTFEGKKATDDLVLQHWRDRLNGISKDDPLHDTYSNAVTQIDYSIHESKMTAQYALGKVSDAAMVSFFLGWANKVPKDSEFYRVLQRDAGQYMRTSSANSAARAKQAEEDRYQSQQSSTQRDHEAAGAYILDTLRRLAQSGYVNGGIPPTISAPGSGSDFTDFDPSDPQVMLKLLQAIEPNHVANRMNPEAPIAAGFSGNTDVLFHNDDKQPVTGQDILNQLAKLDRGFKPGQPFDVTYVTGLLDNQIKGLDERIARANATGHLTDAASLEKSKTYVATINREVAAWPVQQSYASLRATRDAVMNDQSASPAAQLKADAEYRAALTQLANTPSIAADDNLRSRLIAEANGTAGVPTLAESFTGLQQGAFDPASAKDSANQKNQRDFLQAQTDFVASGKGVWTYGKTNAQGVFVPQAGGTEIGAATTDQVNAGGAMPQQVTIPDPKGAGPITMFVTAMPIYATAKNPTTGEALHPLNSNPVAYAYSIVKGGKTVTQYGFQTKDRGFVFSEDPPFDPTLPVTRTKDGLEVDLTPVVAAKGTVNLNANQDFGNGFSVRGVGARGTGGQLVFDPTVATLATSNRNSTAGSDPNTDFNSLTLSFMINDREGLSVLNNLDKNPAFKNQLDSDAYRSSGYLQDENTGQWVPGPHADQNRLNQIMQQNTRAEQATDLGKFIATGVALWNRATTGTPFAAGENPSVPNNDGTSTPGGSSGSLPSDLLKGTPFAAIASIFNPGTNQIKTADQGDKGGLSIQTQGVLKVPGWKQLELQGGAVQPQGPLPINLKTGPVQLGSQAPESVSLNTNTQTGSTAPQAAGGGSTRSRLL